MRGDVLLAAGHVVGCVVEDDRAVVRARIEEDESEGDDEDDEHDSAYERRAAEEDGRA